MRTLGGVLLGIGLFFPGIVLLQWLSVNVLGIYDSMTLTDGCLVMIIILLCVNLAHMRPSRAARPADRRRSDYDFEPTPAPRLRYLPGSGGTDRKRRRTDTPRRPRRR
ncbi:MAG: hypothetical protein HPY69_06750 [Armatimonadetes bacterium]|nr:hypothetical protein [Armatimonadota bacterium]